MLTKILLIDSPSITHLHLLLFHFKMDAEAIPELLTQSEIDLEIDGSASQLGPQPPHEISGQDREQFHSQDFLKWGVRGDIVSLHAGTYHGRPASLMIFEFSFKFPTAVGNSSRFCEATVAATFKPHCPDGNDGGSDTNSPDFPALGIMSPKVIAGTIRTMSMFTETGQDVVIGPPGFTPITMEVGFARTQGAEWVRDHRVEIKGKFWSTKRKPAIRVKNIARWTLNENSALAAGIPGVFRSGLVVEHHDRPICGTVKVSAKTKGGLPLFGWPWSDSFPIVLKPGVSFGNPPRVTEFAELNEEDWKKLCPFDEVVVVS